jgi:iron(III) transport system permease protein
MLGLGAAFIALLMGLAIGYISNRSTNKHLSNLVGVFSYIPFLIPGMAFGAIYIAQFGRPIGPLPALYGTFTLLILAGAAKTLPFASQAGGAAISQVSAELEEAATIFGARLSRRLVSIYFPLISKGLFAGAMLVFVKMVRDLSLMVMLVTPTTTLLSVEAFRYASENFTQFANAITVIISSLSIGATLLVDRVQGASQPWLEKG